MVVLQLLQWYELKLSDVLLTEKEPIHTGILDQDDTKVKNRALTTNPSYQSKVLILHYFQAMLKIPIYFKSILYGFKNEKKKYTP